MIRNSGDAMMVNGSFCIATVGAPLYETYATVEVRLAHFGEPPRRELKREGIHVLSIPARRICK